MEALPRSVFYLLHGITPRKSELYILYFCFSIGYHGWIVNTRNSALSNHNKKVRKKYICRSKVVLSRIMPLGSTHPLREISTRNLSGGKGRPARKADLTAICEPTV
jgi:hypothetical protein